MEYRTCIAAVSNSAVISTFLKNSSPKKETNEVRISAPAQPKKYVGKPRAITVSERRPTTMPTAVSVTVMTIAG